MLNQILNQALSSTNFKPSKAHCDSVYEHIITNTNHSLQQALSHIIGIKNKHPSCYISQSAIAAKQDKRARKTGNRWMNKLHELGLVTKINRPYRTCLYEPKPIFLDRHMRWMLDRVIKSLNFLNIAMLISMGLTNSPFVKNPYVYAHKHLLEENVPRRDNRYYYKRYIAPGLKSTLDGPDPQQAKPDRSGINSQDPRRGIPMNGQKRIKTLKLNHVGEIKLKPFPPEAREYADIQLRTNKKPVKDLFRFYASLCATYCKQNNITPEWRLMFSQLQKEGIDNDATGINPKDPYEYEVVMPKHLDPTAHLSQTTDSDNAPKHSIYHTAKSPTLAAPESRDKLDSNKAKLDELRSSDNPFLAFFAAQVSELIKFVKTTD